MKRTLGHFFKKFTKQKQTPLGRWGIKESSKQIENALNTSSDHCGDFICGKPKLSRAIIKNTSNKN